MSHFTRLKTKIVEKEYLVLALGDLGCQCEEGDVKIGGYGLNRTPVEIRVPTRNQGYDIGFVRKEGAYEMVADWWGIRDIQQHAFLQKLMQRYAYHAARARVEEQGFSLVTEEIQQDGQIHMVLRRMA